MHYYYSMIADDYIHRSALLLKTYKLRNKKTANPKLISKYEKLIRLVNSNNGYNTNIPRVRLETISSHIYFSLKYLLEI